MPQSLGEAPIPQTAFPKKLAAAIRAFDEVTNNPDLLKGKSPKQALEKWLLGHAEECGLIKPDGKPNKEGIEQICKVANWKPKGGATPTQVVEQANNAGSASIGFGGASEGGFAKTYLGV